MGMAEPKRSNKKKQHSMCFEQHHPSAITPTVETASVYETLRGQTVSLHASVHGRFTAAITPHLHYTHGLLRRPPRDGKPSMFKITGSGPKPKMQELHGGPN